MGAIASQITSLTIVYSTVYLDTAQRKYQNSAPLAFVRGIHRGPQMAINAEMFPFYDVIMFEQHINAGTKWPTFEDDIFDCISSYIPGLNINKNLES